jgi:hypothetical protein
MNIDTITTTGHPLHGLRPDDVAADWAHRGLDRISDAELLTAACEVLSIAHHEPADSFALHAPLEMMARARLLSSVSARVREPARQRIASIASTWATTGTPIDAPGSGTVERPLEMLRAAVRDGDQAAADRAFSALCAERNQDEIIGDVADMVLPHLGGAAHGTIFLELLRRFRPTSGNPALMARTLLRDLAAHPDWRLTWFDRPRPSPAPEASLTERLIAPKADRDPASHFVYPTMSVVDDSGLAHELLADVTGERAVSEVRRDLLRIAAMSMLQDEPSNAPYGWSHCLTLPQAALAMADRTSNPQMAIDVAATYVLGFRATQSTTPIDVRWVPDRPSHDRLDGVIGLDPSVAAATAWHAGPEQRGRVVQQLIDHAAPHHDAHLAKYTLACLDAARADADAAHLYLAAAAYLAAWWHRHDTTNE